jgi:hypothetical protein
MPPALAARFTQGELAALRIVSDEVRHHGVCTLHIDAIAARARSHPPASPSASPAPRLSNARSWFPSQHPARKVLHLVIERACVWSRVDPVAQPGSAAVDPFRAEHDPARPAANQSVLPVPPKCAPGRPPERTKEQINGSK